MTVTKALQTIVDNQGLKSLNNCAAYASAAQLMDQDTKDFQYQLPYVISNMTHWRGPLAKQVRQALKGAQR